MKWGGQFRVWRHDYEGDEACLNAYFTQALQAGAEREGVVLVSVPRVVVLDPREDAWFSSELGEEDLLLVRLDAECVQVAP